MGMTVEKIAVSLPSELVAAARAEVAEGRARSVSAYVAEAIRRTQDRSGLQAYLDELVAEYGEPSAEARAWAMAQVERTQPRRRRR